MSKIKGGMANPEEDNARSICMPVGNVHNECMINGSTKKPATLDVIRGRGLRTEEDWTLCACFLIHRINSAMLFSGQPCLLNGAAVRLENQLEL